MERAGTAHPQPVEILEHVHVVRVEPPEIRARQIRAPREQGESQEARGPERRSGNAIKRRGCRTAGGGKSEDDERQEDDRDPILGELRVEEDVLCLDGRAQADEDRKKREKNTSAGLRPREPVRREGRERGKSCPQRRQRSRG